LGRAGRGCHGACGDRHCRRRGGGVGGRATAAATPRHLQDLLAGGRRAARAREWSASEARLRLPRRGSPSAATGACSCGLALSLLSVSSLLCIFIIELAIVLQNSHEHRNFSPQNMRNSFSSRVALRLSPEFSSVHRNFSFYRRLLIWSAEI
jgi:hypothetical protein